ncbi:MAG: hypothetical protein IT168_03010 [Bryobacterales bacterium]|nr:hypothetical protein [Bryobacterales bacterium]
MQVSAEIRWFWREEPAAVVEWFHDRRLHPVSAGREDERVDCYLHDVNQDELGLKVRGNKPGIECKGLVERTAKGVAAGPFTGDLEIWCKWSSTSLNIPAHQLVCVSKRRAIRKFDTANGAVEVESDQRPGSGCNVELTELTLPNGARWWSLGFEAFGGLETVGQSLIRAAGELASRSAPALPEGVEASYPAWLKSQTSGED